MASFPLLATILASVLALCASEEKRYNSFVVSSVTYPQAQLEPYEWSYLRVVLPPSFSFLTVNVLSDVDISTEKLEKAPTSVLPIMCFKNGGLPLPDASYTSLNGSAPDIVFNGSIGDFPDHSGEQCLAFQKNITVKLTNEQIPSGVWYIGYFNGLGPSRTQSKMISRGNSHMFSVIVNVEGCIDPTLWGPYCNQTVVLPTCGQSDGTVHLRNVLDVTPHKVRGSMGQSWVDDYHIIRNHLFQTKSDRSHNIQNTQFETVNQIKDSESASFSPAESIITCNNSVKRSCLGNGEMKIYSLDIAGPASLFKIVANEVMLNNVSSTITVNKDAVSLMCFARRNALPSRKVYDKLADITHFPMVIQYPELGTWYIAIQASINGSRNSTTAKEADLNVNVCYSFNWEVHECTQGKAGLNCTWQKHILQRIVGRNSDLPFHSFYLPAQEQSAGLTEFPLEYLLSNYSAGSNSDVAWTYFLLDIPPGAGGSNLHFQVKSKEKISYAIYSKFGGLPTLDDWDYYANSTTRSNRSMLLMLDELSRETINFYIVYPNEGLWGFAVKHSANSQSKFQSSVSISVEKCPRQCSSHGQCHIDVDQSGFTIFSYCRCDRDHGGYDCSVEIVSYQGHILHSVALIASNAAAILPALWSLRQKAFAEWVVFTCSGISSGVYHACDVGTWCPLKFHVLQFLDFWLSFMAIVSTFLYTTTMSEPLKRAILTGFSILTALLAVNGATRSMNVIVVVAIGTIGLLFGWVLEFSSSCGCMPWSHGCSLNLSESLKSIKGWPKTILNFLLNRFRWHFLLLGFALLVAAAVSWKLEDSESYWIWHSMWHISIYTSSFFFLVSTNANSEVPQPQHPEYELTRQSSNSRLETAERRC